MKKRHNNTERAGLHFVAHTIEDEFGWVFREQSVADVGIDALVEQCVEGNPTGKFIALQIKSGEGNVKASRNYFTYYISNTHYYYWMNLELPIILTCYIKKNKKRVYWVEISKSKIKKTKTRWKIEIPNNQVLTEDAFPKINKIVLNGRKRQLMSKTKINESQIDKLGKIAAMDQVGNSLNFIAHTTDIFGADIRKLTSQTTKAANEYEIEELRLHLFRIQCEFQYILSNYASRIHTEIQIYSQLFSDCLIGFKTKYSILKSYETTKVIETKSSELKQLKQLKNNYFKIIDGVESMKKSIENLKNSGAIIDRENLDLAILAIEQIIDEMLISQELIDDILHQVN